MYSAADYKHQSIAPLAGLAFLEGQDQNAFNGTLFEL